MHSRENIAQVVDCLLNKLGLGAKLLTITSDNASNNKTLVSKLYSIILNQFDTINNPLPSLPVMQFEGLASYIRYIAYVLNLIIFDILKGKLLIFSIYF